MYPRDPVRRGRVGAARAREDPAPDLRRQGTVGAVAVTENPARASRRVFRARGEVWSVAHRAAVAFETPRTVAACGVPAGISGARGAAGVPEGTGP